MPLLELVIRTAASLVGVTVAMVLYTHVLLFLGVNLRGASKLLASLAAYVVAAMVIAAGLMFVLSSGPATLLRENGVYLTLVLVAWLIVVAPGFFYLWRNLPALRAMGFFRAP